MSGVRRAWAVALALYKEIGGTGLSTRYAKPTMHMNKSVEAKIRLVWPIRATATMSRA
ncbi:hypothetical protein S40293_11612 [Stachybotrys chartarum IBT 40293]|nr:hypothetical protein S40293_11612 [Stachybotrys chartarum IBT 40293]